MYLHLIKLKTNIGFRGCIEYEMFSLMKPYRSTVAYIIMSSQSPPSKHHIEMALRWRADGGTLSYAYCGIMSMQF